jgi:four helix bundle protein
MSSITNYRELRVYEAAFEGAMILYEASEQWPMTERYGLTDQVRRSSRSVCANTAEAWFKRRYPRHFASTLSDAGAEATETIVWIDFAERCGHLTPENADALRQRLHAIAGGLVKMVVHPEQWCIPPGRVGEELQGYDLLDSPSLPLPDSSS